MNALKPRLTARSFAMILGTVLLAARTLLLCAGTGKPIELENQYLRYVIDGDGSNVTFADRQTGVDHSAHNSGVKFARLRRGGREFAASQVTLTDGKLHVQFGESGITAVIEVKVEARYLTFEVVSVSDGALDELVFVDVPLSASEVSPSAGRFQACTLALNLSTDVTDLPGPSQHLFASCFPRPGFVGAKAAILGCPREELRNVMKEVVRASKELPQTDRGGPWALDAPANRGSYLIDYPGSICETNVDQWITAARAIGARQIDFHTGHTLRFGDYEPDPGLYPRGLDSLKTVIDKLHAAGIAAGLHTYAFFIAKNSKWVTPVPDPRLGRDATFTLASALTETDKIVPVLEPTKDMSTLTGFQVRNSVTLQIDEELITYSGILSNKPPFAFTDCQRGVHGTKVQRHTVGAKVHHLKECFGLFAPDGDSTLFEEVAARTAEVYNRCGFDMVYLDALDGTDILGRWSFAWKYYSAKFVYSLCGALKQPAIMEMSTFNHQLWFARSRIGAWDAPSKGYKRFIDQHFLDNRSNRENLLPANLGWCCVFDWAPKDRIRTFPDDMEYVLCKSLAGDHSLSWLLGFEPEKFGTSYNVRRLGAMVRQYEDLRLADYFPPSIREQLATPDRDFSLERSAEGRWCFRPVKYQQHKVADLDGTTSRWTVDNTFAPQPVKLRIEALLSLAPYEAGKEVLTAFDSTNEFAMTQSSAGVVSSLQRVSTPVKEGVTSGCFSARSDKTNALCAWTMAGQQFATPVNLAEEGFGVWIHGDGKGEVLNFQWRSPEHLSSGISEHYAVIDFTGWRYFEFVEPESERLMDYGWPYFYANPDEQLGGVGGIKSLNRVTATFWVDYGRLDSLKLWYNNIPKGAEVRCHLSPVKALAHLKTELVNPRVTIGGRTITFPTRLPSGSYLEFRSMTDCKMYDAKGEFLAEIKPSGDIPRLETGRNVAEFSCEVPTGVRARANVTVISQDAKCVGE